MRYIQFVLFTAIAVLYLAAPMQAAPVIVVLNYDLLPNTPGQKIPLYVSGIVPNSAPQGEVHPGNVYGMELSVAIDEGGPDYGGSIGPKITSIDVDSGPTIWVAPNSPAGHNQPAEFYTGQLAKSAFFTAAGFVNVTDGLLATLVVDTTGIMSGIFPLTLSGGAVAENLGDTELNGNLPDGTTISYLAFGGTAGSITIVPEPSSLILGLFAGAGLAVFAVRKRRAHRPLELAR